MAAITSKKPSLGSFLQHSKLIELSDAKLVVGVSGGFQVGQVEKRENREYIEQIAADVLQRKVQVAIQPLSGTPAPQAATKTQVQPKAEAPDPAIQDVLRVFTQGEVIEKTRAEE